MTYRALGLASLAALLFFGPATRASQTDNHGIHAVPVARAVAIDGKLDDWDLSGQVLMCYDLESLRDLYSAQVALMYDAAHLYVGIRWKDPLPLGNAHDPRYEADKGWAGDALQMRFKTDRIAHVTAWYYAPKNEPGLQIAYGKSLTEPFKGGEIQLFRTQGARLEQGAEMAFGKDADGRGYVQEIKLPWKLIMQSKTYRAGDQFRMGVELLWGEADAPVHRYADNLAEGATGREFFWSAHDNWGPVILEAKNRLTLPVPGYLKTNEPQTPGPVEIVYTLPKNARVTLAIDDANNKRVRNLVAAQPRTAGRNVETWDGRDDDDKPVGPGPYRFKALYHDGIRANYVMSYANPGKPTWPTPDDRGAFYADHTAPHAAAAAGDYVALGAPIGEAGRHLIGTDLDGRRLWGLRNRSSWYVGAIRLALATDGKILWVSQDSTGTVYRVNIATGKYAPWDRTEKDAAGNPFRPLDLKVADTTSEKGDSASGVNLSALAVRGDTLAVALARENKVKLLDNQTGAPRAELPIADPRALAFGPGGFLIVLSGDRLVRLAPDGTTSAFANETYPDGYGLAADAHNNVYLSVRGAHQNVHVFSSNGQPLREIGLRGGRPRVGPYNPDAMLSPAAIAVDGRNRLWVVEEAMNPKRTSVWETGSGRLVKDLPGTTTYAGAGSLNPFDPTMAFGDNTVYRISLSSGEWRPVYSLNSGTGNAAHAGGHPDDLFPPVAHNLTSRVVRRGGLTYLFSTDTARGASEVHCTLWDGNTFRSVAHMGVAKTGDKTKQYAKYRHRFFAGQENKAYAWADQNGDGLVQLAEMTFAIPQADGKPVALNSSYWGQLPDADGTIIYKAAPLQALLKFPIARTTPSGAPVYDIARPQVVKLDQPLLAHGGEGSLMGGSEGRVYLNQNPLISVDKDGRVSGRYPSRHVSVHGSHTAKAAGPGYLIGPSSILGVADVGGDAGEVFYLNGNLGENYLFTHDGLWIQSLFKDTRGYFDTPARAVRGMPMDATTAGGESFGGNFVRTPDGKTYVTLGGTDATIIEVSGLESIRRLAGRFTYTPEQYVRAQRLAQERWVRTQTAKVYVITRTDAPAVIEGKADEWPELLDDTKPLLEIRESARQRYGRVSARYDADNLYLAFRVFSPRGRMRNTGQDERLLFKTGDAVDVMLGPSPPKNNANNLRLLMSVIADRPTAVLYQKSVPGTAPGDRVPFSSPWRTITFDRVTRPAPVKVASGAIAGGYFVEAAVPWKALDVRPGAGLKLCGDVGVLFGDNNGTQTVSRQYWSNRATGLVNDVPGEAELTPDLWGTFVLE